MPVSVLIFVFVFILMLVLVLVWTRKDTLCCSGTLVGIRGELRSEDEVQ